MAINYVEYRIPKGSPRNNISSTQLIKKTAQKTGVDLAVVKLVLNAYFNVCIQSLFEGKVVYFGNILRAKIIKQKVTIYNKIYNRLTAKATRNFKTLMNIDDGNKGNKQEKEG